MLYNLGLPTEYKIIDRSLFDSGKMQTTTERNLDVRTSLALKVKHKEKME